MSNVAVFINTGATTVTVGDGLTGDGSGGNPLVAAVDGTTIDSSSGSLAVVTNPLPVTSLVASGDVKAATYHVGASAGIDASVTTAGLVGKTITISKGLVTGFA